MKKLIALFVGLSTLDMVLTLKAVGDGATELNPIMAKVLEQPLSTIMLFKIGLPLLLGMLLLLMDRIPEARHARPKAILVASCIALACVCLWNVGGML